MQRNGYRLVSGGTDNHLMLVDVGARGVTGKDCQLALDEAGITVNKNTIPFETRSPFQASGIRLGSPAVTTRGMKEAEMASIADMISEVLADIKNTENTRKEGGGGRGGNEGFRRENSGGGPRMGSLPNFRLAGAPNLVFRRPRGSLLQPPALV